MAFAQLAYRESLRDIETCLSAQGAKLYHMGFAEPVCRSTLADANEARDWRIYAGLAQRLIAQARRLYAHEALGACGALPGFWVASLAPSARSHDERGKVLGRVL